LLFRFYNKIITFLDYFIIVDNATAGRSIKLIPIGQLIMFTLIFLLGIYENLFDVVNMILASTVKSMFQKIGVNSILKIKV